MSTYVNYTLPEILMELDGMARWITISLCIQTRGLGFHDDFGECISYPVSRLMKKYLSK